MHIEIEAKFKISSPSKVARQLKELGAEFLNTLIQTDTYFDDSKNSFKKSHRALRLRRLSILRKKQAELAFKGPRLKGRLKRRQEIQFKVTDADSVEMLLGELGYKKSLTFQKKRSLWQFGGCEIAIDTLPLLGDFVEIEGTSEKKIAAVQKKLGLSGLPHIPESYAFLMERKLRKGKSK